MKIEKLVSNKDSNKVVRRIFNLLILKSFFSFSF